MDHYVKERNQQFKPNQISLNDDWKVPGEHLLKIIENTPAGICITNEQGIFEYVNSSYCKIYGYAEEELLGEHFTIVVPEKNKAWLSTLHDKFISGQAEVRGEWPVQNKVGEKLFILADALKIDGIDGRPKKITFVTDITDRKMAEDNLAENEILLREALATKDKFLSIIAHDLRNSFQALIGNAQLLLADADNFSVSTTKAHGNEIHRAAQSAINLLNNLLSWAMSQTGALKCEAVSIHVSTAVQMALQPLLNKAKNKGIQIKVDIPDSIFAIADPNMFNTVFRNLISNAIKFSYKNSEVVIRIEESHDFVTIKVTDFGIGMDETTIEKLFDMSSKHGSVGTNGERGTGLGLILCREFVEKQGGKIWASSELENGASFSFTLPRI